MKLICAESMWMFNTLMCLCALMLGGKLAGLPLPGCKTLAAAGGLSGLCSLAAFVQHSLAPLALMTLPGSVALCFHRHGFPACVRCTFTTLCASFASGGAMTALRSAGLSTIPSALSAAALSMALYLLASLMPATLCDIRQVELRAGENAVLLPAMLDSGNLLRDPVTGLGVLVIPTGAARTLFPFAPDLTDLTRLPLGFRLLSVRTAAGSALLPMFRPDLCRIYVNGRACPTDLLVAVAGPEYGGVQALVPMSALPAHVLKS